MSYFTDEIPLSTVLNSYGITWQNDFFLESLSGSQSSEMHGICPRSSEKQNALYLYSQQLILLT